MGLDMYAVAVSTAQVVDDFGFEGEAKEVAYWRKHHDLHGWMERLWLRKWTQAAPTEEAQTAAEASLAAEARESVFAAFRESVETAESRGERIVPTEMRMNVSMEAVAYKDGSEVPLAEAVAGMSDADRQTIAEQVTLEVSRETMLRALFDKLHPESGGKCAEVPDFNQQKVRLTLEDLEALRQDVTEGKLPPTTGFFFGNYPPDEESKVRDLAFVDEAVELIKGGYAVYYDSWW